MGENRKQLEKMILLEKGVWERRTVDAEMDGGKSAKCYGPRNEATKNLENLRSRQKKQTPTLGLVYIQPWHGLRG